MPLSFDVEYLKAIEPLLPALTAAPKLEAGDISSRRAALKDLFGLLFQAVPDVLDVEQTTFNTTAQDGFVLPIHHFAKKESAPDSSRLDSAIVHIHGGGYISLDVKMYKKIIEAFVSSTGVQFFSVDYRLAPEVKFPVPLEDCYTGLQWVHDHVSIFSIDPARLAVMGDSAGGGLAASVAILARDRAFSPPLAKQILIYPMLDDRNNTPDPALEDFATWNCVDNLTGWGAYLGDKSGKDGVPDYAAPARTKSVEGLPATYIDVGGLDIFRDEDVAYAARLLRAGIATELHVYPGVPHAFEAFAPRVSVATRAFENRVKAILSF